LEEESDHDPEVATETQQVPVETQQVGEAQSSAPASSSEVQNSGEVQSEREKQEPLELNLLLHDMPETLDNDGRSEASNRSSNTSTRIKIKNTFLEVVEDTQENTSVLGARRHTAPVGSASSYSPREEEVSMDMKMQMRKADSTPANRFRKGKGQPGKGDSSSSSRGQSPQLSSAFGFTDEPDTVPSEREPVTGMSKPSRSEAKRKPSAGSSSSEREPAAEVDVSVSAIPTDAGSCSMSSGDLASGSASAGENLESGKEEGPKTTIMLRNLPVSFTRDMLLSVLDGEGFSGRYDFVYLPIDFGSRCGFGYAFINLVDTNAAAEFRVHFQGFSDWGIESPKVADITWSSTHQGFEEHVNRYRNSPVMHETMPDECKPIVLRNGVRIDFPPPTKTLRPPRIRPSKNRGGRSMGSSDSNDGQN